MNILIPVTKKGISKTTAKVISALARGSAGKIVILGLVKVPEEKPLSAGVIPARQFRSLIETLAKQIKPKKIAVEALVKVSRNIWQDVVDTAEKEECGLIVLEWNGKTRGHTVFYDSTIDEISRTVNADILVFKPGKTQRLKRILIPLRGGPHAKLVLKVATALTENLDAEITVVHFLGRESSASQINKDKILLKKFMNEHTKSTKKVKVLASRAESIESALIELARQYDLVILGASLAPPTFKVPFGSVTRAVALRTDCSIAISKSARPSRAGIFQSEEMPAPPDFHNVPDMVDKWFAENTFHFREFSDIKELVQLKKNRTISLALPALNEAGTIGKIIDTLKSSMMDDCPLLDEMILIDSGSTDRTCEIAREKGIPVFRTKNVLKNYGSMRGKGEGLWKSLYVTKGDIIVWIDTDIKNIHPKFIYGLLGPLLKYPQIKYMKGFYKRPIMTGAGMIEAGGGRVTELTVRPLVNYFFPELSGLVQPLSGEYAGYRSVLESIKFYTGYGVEIGLLLEILNNYGLKSIGQVDLTKRIHRNQSLFNLSKMSFAIIGVIADYLEAQHKIKLLEELNKSMKMIMYSKNNFHLELEEIEDIARPPIKTIPEYQKRLSG